MNVIYRHHTIKPHFLEFNNKLVYHIALEQEKYASIALATIKIFLVKSK